MTFDIENGILKGYENPDNETEVIIPDGVKIIYDNVFRHDKNIKRVVLSDSVESINENAFLNCIDLEEVIAGRGLRKIGCNAFVKCWLLRKVVLCEGVEEICSFAFSCSGVKEINIPPSVEYIGEYAFQRTPWLEGQTQDFVIVNSKILLKCNNMSERLVIPDGVKYITGTDIFSLIHSVFDDDGMFLRYRSDGSQLVKELVIPDSVEYIGKYAFGHGVLESVYIGDGVKHIAEGAFRNNKNLRTIRFPESLERVEHSAFRKTQWAKDNNNKMVMANSHLLLSGDRSSETVVLPEGIREIADHAFSNSEMTHFVCPKSLRVIGLGAFYDCDKLEKLELNEGLEEIGEIIFNYSCRSVKVEIPSTLRKTHVYAFSPSCRLDINFSTDRQLSDIIQVFEEWGGLYICAPKIPVSQTGVYHIYASIGFMELMVNGGTVSPEIERGYKEHIRENAGDMIRLHVIHPCVLHYMCRERLIPKNWIVLLLERYRGNTEVTAMLLECSRGNEGTDYDI